MTLTQFLSVLTTENAQVTLVDLNTNTEIATFKASGYNCLATTVLAREVKQWSITGNTSLKVVLETTE